MTRVNSCVLLIINMSLQYRNKSKSQLTSPTPAQLPAVALSAGHIWPVHLVWMTARHQQDTFLSWHLAPASEVAGGPNDVETPVPSISSKEVQQHRDSQYLDG
jgi:hypothetical protein